MKAAESTLRAVREGTLYRLTNGFACQKYLTLAGERHARGFREEHRLASILRVSRFDRSSVLSANTQNKGLGSSGVEDASMEKLAVSLVNCARARNLTSSSDSHT